jgi:hypothetical protein
MNEGDEMETTTVCSIGMNPEQSVRFMCMSKEQHEEL